MLLSLVCSLGAWLIGRSLPSVWLATGLTFALLHAQHISRVPLPPEHRMVAVVEGVVETEPAPLDHFAKGKSGTFILRVASLHCGGVTNDEADRLWVEWCGPLPAYGDLVRVQGSLTGFDAPHNPGEFDFGRYLLRKGVQARLETRYSGDCLVRGHGYGNPLVALAQRTSRWMQTQLAVGCEASPEIAALISSMVLGMRGDTPEDLKDAFRLTGTLHLFAVSGLNISMLGLLIGFAFKRLGAGPRTVAALTIPFLGFYAMVTGLGASCVRAATMGILILCGVLIDRPAVMLNSLAAAALCILAVDSHQLFAPGFQFSFVLVIVIVALAGPIARGIAPMGAPDPYLPRRLWNWRQRLLAQSTHVLAESLGVTLSAWVGSLLFTAGYFHLFSPAAILANLLAVPLSFVILCLGVATIIAAPVPGPLAIFIGKANFVCASALVALVKAFAAIPGGHVYVAIPRFESKPALEMVALDVGEGAAVHIRSANQDWLIDGGSMNRYSRITLPYLRSRGVNRLDTMLLTHGDAQHIGSAEAILTDFSPKMILDSATKDRSTTRRAFQQHLEAIHRGRVFAQRGAEFRIGQARATVLFPPAGWRRSTSDDQALIVLLDTEGRRILLTSDAGLGTELWLIKNEPLLRADIVVRGHHSKDDSTSIDLALHLGAKAIVISRRGPDAAEDDEAWTRELQARGLSVFQQSECGAVNIAIRHGEITATAFAKDQRFRSRAR